MKINPYDAIQQRRTLKIQTLWNISLKLVCSCQIHENGQYWLFGIEIVLVLQSFLAPAIFQNGRGVQRSQCNGEVNKTYIKKRRKRGEKSLIWIFFDEKRPNELDSCVHTTFAVKLTFRFLCVLTPFLTISHNYREPVQQSISNGRKLLGFAHAGRFAGERCNGKD